MLRVRFYIEDEDPRPVVPPIHPYWISGTSEEASILVAYVKDLEELNRLWPDARDVDVLQENATIRFSGRFPKPEWFNG